MLIVVLSQKLGWEMEDCIDVCLYILVIFYLKK